MRLLFVLVALWMSASARADGEPTPEASLAPNACRDAAERAEREGPLLLARPAEVRLPGTPPGAARVDATNAEPPWQGPRVDFGYLLYDLRDGWGGGLVHAGSLSGYLPTGRLRLGLTVDAGARDYALGGSDAVVRGTIFAGYQDLGRISWLLPYVVGTVSGGVLVGKRFNTTVVDGLGGIGFEAGAEVNPIRSLHLGLGLGAMWVMMDGLHHATWTFRMFVGL